jgi:hypothetical protein
MGDEPKIPFVDDAHTNDQFVHISAQSDELGAGVLRSLRASRFIPAGSKILVEQPLLLVHRDIDNEKASVVARALDRKPSQFAFNEDLHMSPAMQLLANTFDAGITVAKIRELGMLGSSRALTDRAFGVYNFAQGQENQRKLNLRAQALRTRCADPKTTPVVKAQTLATIKELEAEMHDIDLEASEARDMRGVIDTVKKIAKLHKLTPLSRHRSNIIALANTLDFNCVYLTEPLTGGLVGYCIGGKYVSCMNMSCDPNATVHAVRALTTDGHLTIEVYALRDITECEEINIMSDTHGEFIGPAARMQRFRRRYAVQCVCNQCAGDKMCMRLVQAQLPLKFLSFPAQCSAVLPIAAAKQLALDTELFELLGTKISREIAQQRKKSMTDLKRMDEIERTMLKLQWKNLMIILRLDTENHKHGVPGTTCPIPRGYRVWPLNVCEQLRLCISNTLATEMRMMKPVSMQENENSACTTPVAASAAASPSTAAQSAAPDVIVSEAEATADQRIQALGWHNDRMLLECMLAVLNEYMTLVAQQVLCHHTPMLSYFVAIMATLIMQRLSVFDQVSTDEQAKALVPKLVPIAMGHMKRFLRNMRLSEKPVSALLETQMDSIHSSWAAIILLEATHYMEHSKEFDKQIDLAEQTIMDSTGTASADATSAATASAATTSAAAASAATASAVAGTDVDTVTATAISKMHVC